MSKIIHPANLAIATIFVNPNDSPNSSHYVADFDSKTLFGFIEAGGVFLFPESKIFHQHEILRVLCSDDVLLHLQVTDYHKYAPSLHVMSIVSENFSLGFIARHGLITTVAEDYYSGYYNCHAEIEAKPEVIVKLSESIKKDTKLFLGGSVKEMSHMQPHMILFTKVKHSNASFYARINLPRFHYFPKPADDSLYRVQFQLTLIDPAEYGIVPHK
jgi:hypothetical protein